MNFSTKIFNMSKYVARNQNISKLHLIESNNLLLNKNLLRLENKRSISGISSKYINNKKFYYYIFII